MTDLALSGNRLGRRLGLVRAYLSATAGIVRRDALIRASYRGTLLSTVVSVIFALATFYFVSEARARPALRLSGEYFAFMVVGIVVFGIIQSSLSLPVNVRQELVAGTYERLVLSPFGGTAATVALMIFPILFALAIATARARRRGRPLRTAHPVGHGRCSCATARHRRCASRSRRSPSSSPPSRSRSSRLPARTRRWRCSHSPRGCTSRSPSCRGGCSWISEIQPFTPTVALLRHVLIGFPLPLGMSIAAAAGEDRRVHRHRHPDRASCSSRIAGRYGRKPGTVIEY